MVLKLYGFVGSNATFRALASLFEKELDFQFVTVDMARREHKSPRFLARNPFGQVPMLDDGDLKLFESRAITKYIAHAYADKGTDLLSNDPVKLAIQTVWMEVETQKFDPPAWKLMGELCFKPSWAVDQTAVAESEKKMEEVLDVYEARLTESKYLGGDSFSLADLHHVPNMQYLWTTKVRRLFKARPHVSAWATDIMSRPAWLKVLAM